MDLLGSFKTAVYLDKWKQLLGVSRHHEVLALSVLLLYSRLFAGFILLISLLYGTWPRLSAKYVCLSHHDDDDESHNFAETLCASPYYTAHRPHPGLSGHDFQGAEDGGEPFRFVYYYWLPVVILVQYCLAKLPYILLCSWAEEKLTELSRVAQITPQYDGHSSHLSSASQLKSHLLDDYKSANQLQRLFLDHIGARRFVFHYLRAQILAIICLSLQGVLLDWLFQGHFLLYGVPLIAGSLGFGSAGDTTINYEKIFPYFSTCHYQKFGPSGAAQRVDSFCLLSMNFLNRYVFALLWGCLFLLAILLLGSTLLMITHVYSSRSLRHRFLSEVSTLATTFHVITPVFETHTLNFNELYDCDVLLRKLYFWPLLMLELTHFKGDLLQTVGKLKPALEKANEVNLISQMVLETNHRRFASIRKQMKCFQEYRQLIEEEVAKKRTDLSSTVEEQFPECSTLLEMKTLLKEEDTEVNPGITPIPLPEERTVLLSTDPLDDQETIVIKAEE